MLTAESYKEETKGQVSRPRQLPAPLFLFPPFLFPAAGNGNVGACATTSKRGRGTCPPNSAPLAMYLLFLSPLPSVPPPPLFSWHRHSAIAIDPMVMESAALFAGMFSPRSCSAWLHSPHVSLFSLLLFFPFFLFFPPTKKK